MTVNSFIICAIHHPLLVIKSRRMMWVGHLAHMGKMRNGYKIFVWKPEGERVLRRSGHRWENNITMDLRETVWESVDWVHL